MQSPGLRRLAGVFLLTAATLTGCSGFREVPSPTSTYAGPGGETITVDWADYPGHAVIDGEMLLGHADQTVLEPAARALIGDLRTAISDAAGRELTSVLPESDWFGGESWFTASENGYGGDSLLATVSCCELTVDSVPDAAQWQSVFDAASAVTIAAGLGPFVLRQDSAEMIADPSWSEEFHDLYCTLPGGGCWIWLATATNGIQTVDLSIQDAALDPTGVAAAQNAGGTPELIHLFYGATVVRAGQSDEYARAIAPFIGLERPPSISTE